MANSVLRLFYSSDLTLLYRLLNSFLGYLGTTCLTLVLILTYMELTHSGEENASFLQVFGDGFGAEFVSGEGGVLS